MRSSARRALETFAGAGALLACAAACARLGAVTISEIHYRPPAGDEGLELVELTNETSTPEDVSGYAFSEGIGFELPPGTVLDGYGIIAVCADAALVKARYGILNAVGDFAGRLDSGGERLTLVNPAGAVVASVHYRASGKWPVAPYGTGHTLVLRDLHGDPAEPESWTSSPELGGSPGKPNFPGGEPSFTERVIIDRGAAWRYRKGSGPFSSPEEAWLSAGFDDADWLEGPSGFGFGDGDDATVLDDMPGAYTSVACRRKFTLTAAELAAGAEIVIGVDYDDGFCAFVNGVEAARSNCAAAAVPPWNGTASASREAGAEERFAIPKGLLVPGENVLAVAGYNINVASSDFSLVPRLIERVTAGGGPTAVEEVLIAPGSTWRYWKGSAPFSSSASAWRMPGFDDAAWAAGPSGFGFETTGAGAVAYEVPAGTTGNQSFSGSLGMDFDATASIVVARLGVFDSGADGLNSTLTARLYDRNTRAELARLVFTPADPGDLAGGSRFKDLAAPLSLAAGFQGTIEADGFGGSEPNGNQGISPLALATNSGAGAISFVGGGRFGAAPGQFPDQVDGGPPDRYAAGTFVFSRAGAPGGEIVAPPGVLTLLGDMLGGYASLALRRSFDVTPSQLDEPGDFFLGIDYDDGFCAFLNGSEAVRSNCGAPGTEPAAGQTAPAVREGEGEQVFLLPREALSAGSNVLAIAAYNAAIDDGDFRVTARLFKRRVTAPPGASVLVFNELYRAAAPGGGWLELHNAGAAPADVSGLLLTDDPSGPDPYVFPPGSTVPPGGFLAVAEGESGLELSSPALRVFLRRQDGLVVAAAAFDRAPPPELPPGTWSECRFPDGGPLEWVTRTPTRGAANQVERAGDVVLNEILYHPPEDRPGEFIEIYNRGALAVDLSGFRFTDGVSFTIPQGAVLEPGAYLVVAGDPRYILESYGVAALGPFEGSLSNQGELVRLADRLGNPVDSVRYHEGGRWPGWADGGGSSIELIDAAQDNSSASAWEASDESEKGAWEELSLHVPAYVPAAASELHLYLAERGACRVDDVSIRRSGGPNLVPNPGFEASTSGWILGGTHVRSARTPADAHSGAASLELVATGKGDTLVNRVEVETSPSMTAGPYDVALWARWLRGSNLLVVHGEYSAGPYRVAPCFTCGVAAPNLSGNPLAGAFRLSIPRDLGTPGAENGATRRLREATGAANLGPVIDAARHSPAVPEANAPVAVTASISDPDGVASARVLYRRGSAAGAFDEAPLSDDGLNGDGAAGDGVHGGLLPGFPAGTRVVYFVEAADGRGATRRFPVDAPGKTSLFIVKPPSLSQLDRLQVILDDQRVSELATRQLHSNDLVDGALVFEEREVRYNVGVRYRGSPWGRPSRQSYRVKLPDDAPLIRGLKAIDITEAGTGPNEGCALFLIGRSALPGRPAPVTDYFYVQAWLNGTGLGVKAMLETIDGSFVKRWHGEGARGPLLEVTGRFVFNDSGDITGQTGWEGASLIHRGANPENYRGYFGHRMAQTDDNWLPLIALTQALDPSQTPDAAFDARVGEVVDLDAFLRVLAARALVTDCDAFGINNGHNGYVAFNSLTGLWQMVPFDVECSFVNASPDVNAVVDPGCLRLISRAPTRRVYYRAIAEHLQGYWSAPTASPYLDALQRATGYSTAGIKSFITSSGARARTTLGTALSAPFRILTNAGRDFTVGAAAVVLEGEAPVQVDSLFFRRGAGDPVLLSPAWTTPTRWKATFELVLERNEIEILGFDGRGDLLGSAAITVTTTSRAPGFSRGDADGDGQVDLADAVTVLFHLFAGPTSRVRCLDAADADDSGAVDVSDAISVLGYLFRGGAPPPPPFPACGADATGDALPDCESFCGG